MRVAIAAALGLAAGAGGVALAAPGDGGQVYACTNNLRGSIRVVEAGTACEADETALDWSRQGPAGAPGPAGPQGERGLQGEPGIALQPSARVRSALDGAPKAFFKRPPRLPRRRAAQLQAAPSVPGEARAAFRDGPVKLPSALGQAFGAQGMPPARVMTLPLPPGRWTVQWKGYASLPYDVQKSIATADGSLDSAACKLLAGADSDESAITGFSGTFGLQVVHRFAKPGVVQVECYTLLLGTLSDLKLTATRVSKLKNTAVGG